MKPVFQIVASSFIIALVIAFGKDFLVWAITRLKINNLECEIDEKLGKVPSEMAENFLTRFEEIDFDSGSIDSMRQALEEYEGLLEDLKIIISEMEIKEVLRGEISLG